MKYIDIHTHHSLSSEDCISVRNLLNPDQMENEDLNTGYFSAGIHPWHIHPDHWEEDIDKVSAISTHPHVLAIGEAGLDRLTDLSISFQTDIFKSMVLLSEEVKKPLIIHAVRTHGEIMLLHRQLLPTQPWIIHGFNLRWTIAEALLDHGFFLSFGSAIFQHKSSAALALSKTPLERVFLETDNVQADIRFTYHRAATLLGVETNELQGSIYNNFIGITGYAGS
ncbi:MAG: TatD family hydrolase [Bacteroidia bacterium]